MIKSIRFIIFFLKKSWGHNSVVEHLPSFHKALDSSFSTEKKVSNVFFCSDTELHPQSPKHFL
jgi:hypothetical protein